MKESEAKKKWCPMVRISVGRSGSFNQYSDGEIPEMCNCIASDCMMWVSDGLEESHSREPYGHCGLAK